MSALAARQVGFAFPGPVPALDDVSLSLQPGELVVLIGPTGSGTSTLLRLLAGLLVPATGAVELDGAPVAALGPRERARRLAVVPQGLAAWPDRTVADFVAGGRYAHVSRWSGPQPADAYAVAVALAAADVAEIARRRISELSGGQRQRVLVARALAQDAPWLLVDEPTAALDFEHQVRIVSLLASLADGGRSVLVATHDVNLASQFADRVALLDSGRLVCCGPPAEVLTRAVLEPVYGPHLHVGAMPPPDGRPFVLPWMPLSR